MRILSILFLAFLLNACKNDSASADAEVTIVDSNAQTTVAFPDSIQNLGELKMGEVKEIKFTFTNTGETPLLIVSAQPSCGCTVADYPKKPIAPGKGGEIVANFDTNKGAIGSFTKVITVMTNTKPSDTHTLTFSGDIKPASADSTQASSSN